jgi:hypothetical protein
MNMTCCKNLSSPNHASFNVILGYTEFQAVQSLKAKSNAMQCVPLIHWTHQTQVDVYSMFFEIQCLRLTFKILKSIGIPADTSQVLSHSPLVPTALHDRGIKMLLFLGLMFDFK